MNIELAVQSVPVLLGAAIVSLQIAFLSCAIGVILGTLLGLLHASRQKYIMWAVSFYVNLIRGTPMIIQIFLIFFGLPHLCPYINISPFMSAVVAIGLNSSAYVSNIIKAGINSVDKGQIEAAHVLGLSKFQTMRFIVLPQAIRVVFPALGNEFITLIKDSSLASVIGVVELTAEGGLLRSRHYDALTIFMVVAVIYLCMTSVLSFILSRVEARIKHVNN